MNGRHDTTTALDGPARFEFSTTPRGVKGLSGSEGDGAAKVVGSKKALGSSLTTAERSERRLAALGLSSSFDPFPCRLPRHDHAATLHPGPDGRYLLYRCADGEWSGGLAEVRASIAYGEARHLRSNEAARWGDRLDFDAGIRKPIPFAGELPEGLGDSARIVLEHLRLLVGLRERLDLSVPFVFARPFGVAYTGLSGEKAIQLSLEELERRQLIKRVGKGKYAILWKLADQDKPLALKAVEHYGGNQR